MISELRTEQFYPRYDALMAYSRLLHGYFVDAVEDGGLTPGVAESWSFSPNGRDWTFKLRKGVKFHNGEEATVEDALFSLHRPFGLSEVPTQHNATNQSEGRLRSKPPEITGPNEVTIFKDPNPFFLSFFSPVSGSSTRTALVPRKLLGEPYDQTETAYQNNPVGSGAMKFVAHAALQSMTFERFDHCYYQPSNGLPEDRRVQVKTLELKAVPELSTRVAAFRAGQSDLIEAALAVKDQIEGAGGRFIFAEESSYILFTLIDCWVPAHRCHDKRVRQALDWAVDEELIRDTLYSKEVAVVAGFQAVTPSSLGYTPELKPYGFDPAKARELINESGRV